MGDQHHTAASHLGNYICGQLSVTEQKYKEPMKDFFSGGEKSWTSQGKCYSEQKDVDKEKDKGLPP